MAAYSPAGPHKLIKFQRRALGPKDVAIKIHYCGICHSDIHPIREDWGKVQYPQIVGHELAGAHRRAVVAELITINRPDQLRFHLANWRLQKSEIVIEKGLGPSHLSNSPSLSTRDNKTIPGSMVV
jgi:hypothetical protein